MSNNVVVVGRGGHKVLALHGWFGSAEGWGPMVETLDRERFTYAFMDYRGYGGSRHLRGTYTLEEIAGDALAAADALGWERFSLLGHSMGGAAIQHVLVRAPRRVRALIGVTPVPASGVSFSDEAWQLFTSAAGDNEARRAILDVSTGRRLSSTFIDQLLAFSVHNSTPEAFGAYLPSWAKTDISAQVEGNPVPVQLFIGEHDQALTAALMTDTWMRWYPNAKLDVLGNAGHYPIFETPVALCTAIERFLVHVV